MNRRLFRLLLSLALFVSGCSASETSSQDTLTDQTPETTIDSEMFSARDFEIGYDVNESISIHFTGNSASCTSDLVKIDGSTITITGEGTYLLSGTLDDGMVIVDAKKTDKIQLVLNGVTIHSETCAPLYILQTDKVFITTVANTTNIFSNGGTFTAIDENNIDAVIFSKEDLTLNGEGTLLITSPAGHGIVSKDSLKVTSGIYDINCANHGLVGKDDVCIANAKLSIVSGKDGIHADNADDQTLGFVYIQSGTFDISAEGDGLSASANMTIMDGTFDITAGGGSVNAASKSSQSWGNFMGGGRHGDPSMNQPPANAADDLTDSTSMKGIKASSDLVINGGSFHMDTADDAVHTNASLTVNGGSFDIASGDDGFHADETLTVIDGSIQITQSYEGLEGLHVNISGGDITLSASDDGINAAGGTDASGMTGGRDGMFGPGKASSSGGTIKISGGTLHITAYGDGIDANGSLEISGGYTIVTGPTQGDTSTLDYDTTGIITGGTFIGTGAASMAQSFSDSQQGVIAVRVSNPSATSEIKLSNSSGQTIMTYTPDLSFEIVILSSPEIIKGQSYTLTVGANTGEVTAN